jgi:branched-chain amino acid aminotransferase
MTLNFVLMAMIPSRETPPEIPDLDWENLGFTLVDTDFMYMAKCGPDGNFSQGEMLPFGPIALSPSAGVLNYGQVCE